MPRHPAEPTLVEHTTQHWIDRFLHHLQTERRLAANTCKHYQRDLDELHNWCKAAGINDWRALDSHQVRKYAAQGHRRGLPQPWPMDVWMSRRRLCERFGDETRGG